MSLITDTRRELQTQARLRHSEVVPKLRKNVKDARRHKSLRLKRVRKTCKKMIARVQADAVKARQKLRERIAAAKLKAREVCAAAKSSATEEELDAIDRALEELATEREAIKHLRVKARRLRDPRGRQGGLTAQEKRRESDDYVRAELEEDPIRLAIFDRVKSKIVATPRRSRVESFLEYLHDHPEAYDEEQNRQHTAWAADAERMFEKLARTRPAANMDEGELQEWIGELDEAQRHMDRVSEAGDGW